MHNTQNLAPRPPMFRRLPGTPEPMHVWQGSGGVRIAGDAWGNPAGPLILLLHGGGQTRHAWGGTGAQLGAAGYRAVAFDARGHGDSDWADDGDYSPDAMVRDLQQVLEALGRHRPVLVGASMGGVTSLVAVGENQVDAAALILVDIVPSSEPQGVQRIQSFMRDRLQGFDSLDEVARAIGTYRGDTTRTRAPAGLAKNVRLGEDGRFYWHYDPRFATHPRDLAQRQARLEACARRLRLPTLLVRGAKSDVVSEKGAQEFLALCPHAEHVNVAQAGHMVAGDRNDAFGRAAMGFLGRIVPARPPAPAHDLQPTPPDPPG